MSTVILESWREGLQKITLTKLQIEILDISLKEAKENVDALLDGQKVILRISDDNLAREFVVKANRIGVNCKIVNY